MHGLLNNLSGSTDIQSHIAFTSGTEHLSVVKCETGLLLTEFNELVVSEPKIAAIQPDKERRIGPQRPDGGNMLPAVVNDEIDIPFDIAEHLAAPLVALCVGGNGCYRGEDVRSVEFVGLEPSKESRSESIIGYDGIRGDNPGDVKGLGGSLEGDGT